MPNTEYTVQMCTINRSGCGSMTNITTNTQCKSVTNGKAILRVLVSSNISSLKFLAAFSWRKHISVCIVMWEKSYKTSYELVTKRSPDHN